MKHAILLSMVTQLRNPKIVYDNKLYQLSSEGMKIKRIITILQGVLLVLYVVLYPQYLQPWVINQFGDSIVMSLVVVVIAYLLIMLITYLLGLVLITPHKNNLEELVQSIE